MPHTDCPDTGHAYLRFTSDTTPAVVDVSIRVDAVCRACGRGTSQCVTEATGQDMAQDAVQWWADEHADVCTAPIALPPRVACV